MRYRLYVPGAAGAPAANDELLVPEAVKSVVSAQFVGGGASANAQLDDIQSFAVPVPDVCTNMLIVTEALGWTRIVPVEPFSVVVFCTAIAAAT